jgi:hypothetical protein
LGGANGICARFSMAEMASPGAELTEANADLGYGEENDDADDDTQVGWRVEDSRVGQSLTTELK